MTHRMPRRALLGGALLAAPLLARPANAWQLFPTAAPLPDVPLLDQARRPWRFRSQALTERPAVAIELIYAGCSSICPISTRVMAEARTALGTQGAAVRCLSLTLDPEADTPERLAAYAEAAGAAGAAEAGDWLFLTGTRGDMRSLLRALRARFGHPDDHAPVFFVGDGATPRLRQLFAIPPPDELAAAMLSAIPAGARPG